MNAEPVVYVVDDDPAVRDSVTTLLDALNVNADSFASAGEFLDAFDPDQPGCVVLDVRMPGMGGFELQSTLNARDATLPVIFISGHGECANAVRAMKGGAIDFLEKPLSGKALLERIREAIRLDAERRIRRDIQAERQARINRLSPREREVLDLLVSGNSNKQVAAQLGISKKTADTHRAHIMKKLEVESFANLVHLTLAARIESQPSDRPCVDAEVAGRSYAE